MLNQFVICGKLDDLYLKDNANITKGAWLVLECDDSLIKLSISSKMLDEVKSLVNIGAVVGAKGKIITNKDTKTLELDVVKLTFLSSDGED